MSEISIIGGINVDIEGAPYGELVFQDSNPGRISISFGGVGRNITENIVRMGGSVALISVAGEDFAGIEAKEYLDRLGVNTEHIRLLPDQNTAMYLSILNNKNDMELAICNMDILENITSEFIDDKALFLAKSKMVALDCNLSFETLDYITDTLKGTPLFLDPVSAAKANRIRPIIGRFHTIKPNIIEAEIISGIKIVDETSLHEAGMWFLEKGVKQVFISLSQKGVYFLDRRNEGILSPGSIDIVSATGAGDAFSAAVILGTVEGMPIKEIAKFGMASAEVAMESKTAVNIKINKTEVIRRMKNV